MTTDMPNFIFLFILFNIKIYPPNVTRGIPRIKIAIINVFDVIYENIIFSYEINYL
jgi:hypothetical protein